MTGRRRKREHTLLGKLLLDLQIGFCIAQRRTYDGSMWLKSGLKTTRVLRIFVLTPHQACEVAAKWGFWSAATFPQKSYPHHSNPDSAVEHFALYLFPTDSPVATVPLSSVHISPPATKRQTIKRLMDLCAQDVSQHIPPKAGNPF